jgi:hypothetical protein
MVAVDIAGAAVKEAVEVITLAVGSDWKRECKFQGGAGRKDADVNECEVRLPEPCKSHDYLDHEYQETIQVASNYDMVLIYLQYDVYDSPIPSSFLRSAPIMANPKFPTPPLSSQAISTYGPEECMIIIVLTSEIGRGTTSVVHRGTLKLETSGLYAPLDVVVKLGFDNEQQDRSEYEVYHSLRKEFSNVLRRQWVSSMTPKVVLALLSCSTQVVRSPQNRNVCRSLTGKFFEHNLFYLINLINIRYSTFIARAYSTDIFIMKISL